jgi:CheY-like chemotaxis protein
LNRTLGADIKIGLYRALDLWPVVVDPAQLQSAIANLANNARDAMPKGGRLIITTRNSQLDEDYAASHIDVQPGDYVLIEVTDNGSGMPPNIVEKIFEPFFTTKDVGKGTGLGLSMVFGFIKQSGGHINVYSEPAMGTTFRLYLPRAADVGTAPNSPVTVTTETGHGETVLVVEDDTRMRRIVERQLRELGYQILEAENAAAALDLLASRRIDLLFTDVVMPGEMNGIELAHIAGKRWPLLKIVLTSGFPESKIKSRGAPIPGVRLLGKPYRKEELARVLHEAIEALPLNASV